MTKPLPKTAAMPIREISSPERTWKVVEACSYCSQCGWIRLAKELLFQIWAELLGRRGFVDDDIVTVAYCIQRSLRWSERQEWLFPTSIMSFIVLSKKLPGKLMIDKTWNFPDCRSGRQGLFEVTITIQQRCSSLLILQPLFTRWTFCIKFVL